MDKNMVKIGVLWMEDNKTVLIGVEKTHLKKIIKSNQMSFPVGVIRKDLEKQGVDWNDVVDLDFVSMEYFDQIHKDRQLTKIIGRKMKCIIDEFEKGGQSGDELRKSVKEILEEFKDSIVQNYGSQKDPSKEKK